MTPFGCIGTPARRLRRSRRLSWLGSEWLPGEVAVAPAGRPGTPVAVQVQHRKLKVDGLFFPKYKANPDITRVAYHRCRLVMFAHYGVFVDGAPSEVVALVVGRLSSLSGWCGPARRKSRRACGHAADLRGWHPPSRHPPRQPRSTVPNAAHSTRPAPAKSPPASSTPLHSARRGPSHATSTRQAKLDLFEGANRGLLHRDWPTRNPVAGTVAQSRLHGGTHSGPDQHEYAPHGSSMWSRLRDVGRSHPCRWR